MSSNDSFGDRMKAYEDTCRHHLLRRTPVIIRVDGRAFHTFTKCLKHYDGTLKSTPFSTVMHDVMVKTMVGLLENIQNSVFAYTQSDEISIFLRDWDTLETQQWFDGTLQKMVSIAAAQATITFNRAFDEHRDSTTGGNEKDALFDARAFNIPESEVVNYFLWRQQDAMRNSVQMLGRFHFSQKQMHGKPNMEVLEMLKASGHNWKDIMPWMQKGSCAFKIGGTMFVEDEIPAFKMDRDYIGRHLTVDDDKVYVPF